MPSTAWRLLALPFILLAFMLVGSPEFPAFDRAVAHAFRGTLSAATPAQPDARVSRLPVPAPTRQHARPKRGVLVPLYVSFAALQVLDTHSTLRALNAGATEANPIMGGVAGRPAAFVAVKAGLAASTIYFVEKVRVKSRGAAVVLMAALNSVYATIVAHNYRFVP